MFRPNSIRGLLEKRDEKNVNAMMDRPDSQEVFDPEIEDIVDLKCAIKDVNLTIQGIRDWRQQQKKELQRSLQLNMQVFAVSAPVAQDSGQNEQLQKFQAKIAEQQKTMEMLLAKEPITQSEYLNEHQNLLLRQVVTGKVQEFQRRKNQLLKARQPVVEDSKQAFMQSLKQMGNIFKPLSTSEAQSSSQQAIAKPGKPKTDARTMEADLQEIDRQLKQLQQLLRE